MNTNSTTARTLNEYQMAIAPAAAYRSDISAITPGPRFHTWPYIELLEQAENAVLYARDMVMEEGAAEGDSVMQHDREYIARDLGAVLHAVAQIAYDLDIKLSDVANDSVLGALDGFTLAAGE